MTLNLVFDLTDKLAKIWRETLVYLESRNVDFAEITAKLDTLDSKLDAGFAAAGDESTQVAGKLDALVAQVATLNAQIAELQGQINTGNLTAEQEATVGARIDALIARQSELNARITEITPDPAA